MSFFEFPNTRTYDSDLGWLIRAMRKVVDEIDTLDDWKATHEAEYKELKKLYDDIMMGAFPEPIIKAFNNWMSLHALDLVGNMVKNVYFGLSQDGYFVAYIPESWSDIIFKTTGLDIATILEPEYGHLVLLY